MAKHCTNCGAELKDTAKFCDGCGTKNEIETANAQEQAAPVAPPLVPVKNIEQSDTRTAKPTSALQYFGYTFIMLLPFAGLVFSILFSLKKEPSDKRSLARAMIFFSVVSLVLCIVMSVLIFIFTQTIEGLHFKIFGITIF